MFAHYDDILANVAMAPVWFDEHAVPRFCAFEPGRSASIYISEIALAEITCQGCKRPFHVAFSAVNVKDKTIAEAIVERTLHYGDPPNVECCPAGPSMNSEPRRVLEYWSRCHRQYTKPIPGTPLLEVIDSKNYHRWTRDRALEVSIEPDWVSNR